MDSTLIACIAAGIALVLLVFLARVALRWVIRLVVVGLLLLLGIGGAAWWWLNQSSRQSDNKPRQTSTRRGNTDRQ